MAPSLLGPPLLRQQIATTTSVSAVPKFDTPASESATAVSSGSNGAAPDSASNTAPDSSTITAPDSVAITDESTDDKDGDPSVDLMDTSLDDPEIPNMMGRTENNSATYVTSGNPNLDFFFQVVPDTPSSTVTDLLSKSWNHDPLTALKLVCNLRGVRGTGKSDKEGFYSSALWIHSNHPKTLALNVSSFAEFGYMKDLLEILYRLLNGLDARELDKENRVVQRRQKFGRHRGRGRRFLHSDEEKAEAKEKKKVGTREERLATHMEKLKIASREAEVARKMKIAEMAKKVIERYTIDTDFRLLHDCVSDFFSGMLSSDAEMLKLGKLNQIGLAAKWCPSLDSSFDKSTLVCESVARKMWPKDSVDEYKDIAEEHYVYKVRDRLRREVLVPLRKALELPEVYMSARQWDSLPYNRVASVAMKRYTKIFKKHDLERFEGYLTKVKEGKAKIAAGALLPHEILASARDEETRDVAELQWERMVKDMLEKGKLKDSIAVCDVSGSMSGTPMEVCIALGMLLSELSEEPWKGKVITFSHDPQIHVIEGKTITEKMEFVQQMDWGWNTNFQKVFDLLLEVAKDAKLVKDDMLKRVFVFSDMEFDQASANDWETDYMAICRKFSESGYGDCVPEIVFWNLRDSRSTPVVVNQKGVALVSGFSKNLMKVFLEGGGQIDPITVMEDAISGKEYQKLVVFD